MFRTGQRVEVWREPGDAPDYLAFLPRIQMGGQYTVSNVYTSLNGRLMLELVELPQPGGTFAGVVIFPGYKARFFRPLTDILIFTEMLRRVPVREDA